MKFSQKKILNDKLDKKLIKLIRTKKVWCAASTHDGEENICLKVHNKLIKKYKNLMLIIIPRHIVRVNSILKDIYALNLKPHLQVTKVRLIQKLMYIWWILMVKLSYFLTYVRMFLLENL